MTTTQRIAPCLWLDGTADALAAHYTQLFPRSRIVRTSHYGKEGFEHHGQPEGSTLVVDMELDGYRICALNAGPIFKINPSISLFAERTSEAEVDALWNGLVDGGQILMPLGAYPWSAKYGWLNDRFGVSWQIVLASTGSAPNAPFAPAMLFTGAQAGRAEEAMTLYRSVFPASALTAVARHDGSGTDAAGTILVARFQLFGQPFLAMDSAAPHSFAFNEGLSLIVTCDTQAEIDHYWGALTADGGAESMCGWLKDRFGVSWQIVPRAVHELLTSSDRAAASRVMRAIFGMRKLDIAKLEAAFAGKA